MKIIIRMESKYAVILIAALTILGWIFAYAIIYTSYYLATGEDPFQWIREYIPPELYSILSFIGKYGGYISIIVGMIIATIIAVLVAKSRRK